MEKTKDYFLYHLAAPFMAMLILIAGAFIVYKGYYTDPHHAKDFALMEPAAGDTGVSALEIRFSHKDLWQ